MLAIHLEFVFGIFHFIRVIYCIVDTIVSTDVMLHCTKCSSSITEAGHTSQRAEDTKQDFDIEPIRRVFLNLTRSNKEGYIMMVNKFQVCSIVSGISVGKFNESNSDHGIFGDSLHPVLSNITNASELPNVIL